MIKKSLITLAAVLVAFSAIQSLDAEEGEMDIGVHLRRLKEALLNNCDKLPEVDVNQDYATTEFSTTDMTKSLIEIDGQKYCAFKFRTPKTSGHMVWAFSEMKGLICCCICGQDSPMLGFICKEIELDDDLAHVGKKGEKVLMQRLSSREIKPDTEYIMWFNIEDDGETELTHSMNCFEGDDIREYEEVFTMLY